MPSPAVSAMRRQLMILVGSVVALDLAAGGLYYALDIKDAASRTQMIFAGVWTVATLAVVLRGLSRVRAARGRRGA
jgi:hypothetical protein